MGFNSGFKGLKYGSATAEAKKGYANAVEKLWN